MMCIFKINKFTPGQTSITVETDIRKEYNKYDTGGDDDEGTSGECLAKVLNTFTTGTWKWKDGASPADVTDLLFDKVGIKHFGPVSSVNPAILGVDWDGSSSSHWVVVDTIREFAGTYYATVCDPWDANVHMQKCKKGEAFLYDASTGGFMVNFGSNALAKDSHRLDMTVGGVGGKDRAKTPYTNSDKGQVKHWGIVYRDA
jgi:hypothetical protein